MIASRTVREARRCRHSYDHVRGVDRVCPLQRNHPLLCYGKIFGPEQPAAGIGRIQRHRDEMSRSTQRGEVLTCGSVARRIQGPLEK
jgi:hypothetical protein